MALFRRWLARKDGASVNNKKYKFSEMLYYEEEPMQAAWIINDSLEKKHYSEMSQRLEDLPSTGYKRKKYVFESLSIGKYLSAIIFPVCGIIVYIYFIIIGTGMHLFSDNYEILSTIFLGSAVFVIALNSIVLGKAIQAIRFSKRYEKYYQLLKYKNVEIVDDIGTYVGLPNERVVNDLRISVKKKLIPQGHFLTEDLVFIVSDALYSQYEDNKLAYDKYYKHLIEERIQMEERPTYIKNIFDQGQEYLEKFYNSNSFARDKTIAVKLNQIEKIVSIILREVDLNPIYANKLSLILDYYLPTIDKLLSAYIDADEEKIRGNIENAIDMVMLSFEGILNYFYESLEMDISNEVSNMEKTIN